MIQDLLSFLSLYKTAAASGSKVETSPAQTVYYDDVLDATTVMKYTVIIPLKLSSLKNVICKLSLYGMQ